MSKIHDRRLIAGLCIKCGKTPIPGQQLCKKCAALNCASHARRRKRLIAKGVCIYCGKNKALESRRHCGDCATKTSISKIRGRRRLKIRLMTYYCGGAPHCMCPKCDEVILEFLTIDHMNNDGKHHRNKQIGVVSGGYKFYLWLNRNGCPPGFQVLCFNCNSGRHINGGVCPHLARKLD